MVENGCTPTRHKDCLCYQRKARNVHLLGAKKDIIPAKEKLLFSRECQVITMFWLKAESVPALMKRLGIFFCAYGQARDV